MSITVAPPKMGAEGKKVGLFSTRSPHRPNAIGLTLAKIEKVDRDELHITEHDLIEGTPILDIKPYIADYDEPSRRISSGNNFIQDRCHQ